MICHWLLLPGASPNKDLACVVQASAASELEDKSYPAHLYIQAC